MGKSTKIKALGTNKAFDDSKVMKVWSDGRIIKGPRPIDSLNFSLHYSSPCVWEGIRSYKQKDGSTKVFKLEAHISRLLDSAKIIGFDVPYNKGELIEACKAVVEANGGGDLYLRPVVFSLQHAENAKPQEMTIAVDIYAFPIKPLHVDKPAIKCIISSFRRGYPQFQMQAKTAANYGILEGVKAELKASGADEALIVDNLGYITEATVANLWIFKGNVAFTPPNNGSILPGITRATVSEILSDPSIMFVKHKKPTHIVEKQLTKADIYTADCAILCGTYAEIVKIGSVDGRQLNNNDEYYRILKDEYANLVRTQK